MEQFQGHIIETALHIMPDKPKHKSRNTTRKGLRRLRNSYKNPNSPSFTCTGNDRRRTRLIPRIQNLDQTWPKWWATTSKSILKLQPPSTDSIPQKARTCQWFLNWLLKVGPSNKQCSKLIWFESLWSRSKFRSWGKITVCVLMMVTFGCFHEAALLKNLSCVWGCRDSWDSLKWLQCLELS